jgi:hypothetical protein
MDPLEVAVLEILLSRGFQVCRRDGYLIAHNEEVELAFCLLDKPGQSIRGFRESFQWFRGRKILATLEEVPQALLDSLDDNLFIWDRNALEAEIGQCVREDVKRRPKVTKEDRVRSIIETEDEVAEIGDDPPEEALLYL